jgi:Raf kinase inhibitor-like YbhB/YbcL family protein
MCARSLVLAIALTASSASGALAFEVSSPSMAQQIWGKKFIAKDCGGQNVSPAVTWANPPPGTKSFALTLFDPDALEGIGWWHWQVLRIPGSTLALPEGAGSVNGKGMPKGVVQGRGDIGIEGYYGPCPPAGSGMHRYTFTLYALKTSHPDTERYATPGMIVADVMRDAIGKATVVYKYGQ